MATWTALARLTERVFVTVKAETHDEAIKKFEDMEWEDGSGENGEVVDWELISNFTKDPE